MSYQSSYKIKDFSVDITHESFGLHYCRLTSLELHELNVYPAGTLNEPFVQELAAKLKECILANSIM